MKLGTAIRFTLFNSCVVFHESSKKVTLLVVIGDKKRVDGSDCAGGGFYFDSNFSIGGCG